MKKVGKILIITLIALLLALVVATIVLACVPNKYYDAVYSTTSTSAEHINVYRNGKSNGYVKDSAEYSKVVELYKKGLKENKLLALFDGTLSSKPTIEKYSSSVALNSSVNSYIEFSYSQDQTLMYNGAVYKNSNGNEVTFRSIIVALTNATNNMQSINVYVCSSQDVTTATPVYKLTTMARQYELIDYISTLDLISL